MAESLKISRIYVIVNYVRIFKNTWFARFASKEGIMDSELKAMVNQLEAGNADADLGGGVYKVRIARPGKGKSGGYRVLVYYRIERMTFFRYGFAKSARDNISQHELRILKKQAKDYFAMTDEQIEEHLADGRLLEIT